MKQYRPLKLVARFFYGFAWLGMILGIGSLILLCVNRLVWDIPFNSVMLAQTGAFLFGCLVMYAIAQTVLLLLRIEEKLEGPSSAGART